MTASTAKLTGLSVASLWLLAIGGAAAFLEPEWAVIVAVTPAVVIIAASTRQGDTKLALGLTCVLVASLAMVGRVFAKLSVPVTPSVSIYATDIVVTGIIVFGFREAVRARFDALSTIVAAFMLLGTIWLLVAGRDPYGVGIKAFSFVVYGSLFFVVRQLAGSPRHRASIGAFLIAGVLASGAIGLINALTVQAQSSVINRGFLGTDVIFTSTGSTRYLPGEFAMYGATALLLIFAVALAQQRMGLVLLAALGAAIVDVVIVQSRSALVAAAMAIGVMILLLPGRRKARLLFGLTLGFALIASIVVLSVNQSYLADTLIRARAITDFSDVNASWRILNWLEVLIEVATQPLGHGFATFDFSFTRVDPFVGSHNSWVDLAYRVGLPGVGLLALFIGVLLARLHRSIRVRQSLRDQMELAALGGAVAFAIVFASFNMVFESPYTSTFFWTLLGTAAGALDGPPINPDALPRGM